MATSFSDRADLKSPETGSGALGGHLVDLVPAAVYTCDAHGHITYFNKRAVELWGRTPRLGDADQKFCGSLRLYYPDGRLLAHNRTPMALALQRAEPFYDEEVVIERPDGSSVTVLVNIDPIFDADGELTGAVNVFQDISERKRLADQNRAQRALLERIIRDVPAGIAFLQGPEHRFTVANPAYMQIARGKGDIIGRTVAEVWPEVGDRVIPLLDGVFHTEKPFQATDMPLTVDREWGPELIHVTFSYIPMYGVDGEVEGVLALVLETSDEVQARKQVEQERAFLQAVLKQMPSGVLLVEAPSGKILLSNNQVGDLYRRADIPSGNMAEYEALEHLHVDGQAYDPDDWPLWRAIRNGDVTQNEEMRISRGDGTEAVININASPIYAEDGAITAAIAVFHDVSERKQAEVERERLLRALEHERAQLTDLTATLETRVAERTRQVRELASALTLAEQRERARISQVLHDDLQQILYSQLMRLEMLRQDLPDEQRAQLQSLLSGMSEQLEQAVHVTRALTAELNPPKVKTGGLQEALHWLAGHMQEAHNLRVTVTGDPPAGDVAGVMSRDDTRDLLLQMVRELLFNVVKHARAEHAAIHLTHDDDNLVVRVEDDGAGFDVDRLKAGPAEQEGLGLFSIANRLELIGGHLDVTSAPGEGTRVTILAPLE